jgi:hypothetical protein
MKKCDLSSLRALFLRPERAKSTSIALISF